MKNVSAAIVIRNREILIGRRSASVNLTGFWEFPGGKQDPGETIQECLERELFEELSVTSIAGNIFHESIFEYDGGTINLIGIITELLDTNFTLSVHDKVEWVQINELLSYKLAPADIPIAEKIRNTYG
jgi:8-oxo-dGTP diphosphatase